MSESTLLRQVKRLTGLSPQQYLQEVRLDAARRLLEDRTYHAVARVAAVCGAIGLIWWISRVRPFDEAVTRLATAALRRWTELDVHDYATLLHVGGEYVVTELQVGDDDWLAGRGLASMSLREEGVIVLGLERVDGTYFGVPKGSTVIEAGDVLVLYGRAESIAELGRRRRGHSGDTGPAA